MDFDFDQGQYMFLESVRDFLSQGFSLDRVRLLLKGDGTDAELWDGLTELGLFSVLVPEDYGGLGLSFVDLALILEECGRALVPSPVAETVVSTDAIVRYGTDEQKARLLPKIAEGGRKLVPALTEASGFGIDAMATTATEAGNGWRLDGSKILVPQAATADLIAVAVRFAGDEDALGLVLVEPDREGVSLREHTTLDPSLRFHEVIFDNVSIVQDDVLGGAPAPGAVERLWDASGSVAAAQLTGISGKMLDDAVDYAGQRTQFGKPIGSFQAIKHKCADMAVAIDASRSAAYYAAWALAEDAPDRAKAVSIAKSYCGDASRMTCNEGLQIHGGVGFTWELGLHYYLRRAKVLEYSYGDASWHRERVLAATLAEMNGRS